MANPRMGPFIERQLTLVDFADSSIHHERFRRLSGRRLPPLTHMTTTPRSLTANFLQTSWAAIVLKTPHTKLAQLTDKRRMVPPQKDSAGRLMWSYDDVCRASQQLEIATPTTDEFEDACCSCWNLPTLGGQR